MNTMNSILEKIANAPSLDFGTIFSDAFDLFKKTWIQGFLLQLFSMIIMLPLIIIVYVPIIGLYMSQAASGDYEPEAFNAVFAGFSVLFITLIVVGALLLSTVTIALQAGFFRIMKKMDHDENVLTSDFFHFVKGAYLGKLFVLMLLVAFITTLAALLCGLPLLYVIVPVSFFTVFFAFNPEFSVGDIMKLSFALGNKKWLLVFGLMLVSYFLIFTLTILTCGLGGIFLNAFIYHPLYLVYKNVIGFGDELPTNHIIA